MKCEKCGLENQKNVIYCQNCGNKLVDTTENTMKEKNNKSKLNLVIIIIFIIILVITGIGCYILGTKNQKVDCNNVLEEKDNNVTIDDDNQVEYTFKKFDTTNPKFEVEEENDLSKNVSLQKIFFYPQSTYSSQLAYIYGVNNNSVPIDITIYLYFYDKDGKQIERNTSGSQIVFPNREFSFSSYILNDTYDYEKYKVVYSVKNVKSYYELVDLNKLNISAIKDVENTINYSITNNSDVEIQHGYVVCLYYKDDEVVYSSYNSTIGGSGLNSLKPGQVKTGQFFQNSLRKTADYNSKDYVEYDDYKIVLMSAYNIKENY